MASALAFTFRAIRSLGASTLIQRKNLPQLATARTDGVWSSPALSSGVSTVPQRGQLLAWDQALRHGLGAGWSRLSERGQQRVASWGRGVPY